MARIRTAAAAAALCAVTALVNPAKAQELTQPTPLMSQIQGGNWLDETEARSLREQMFYVNAIHAYRTVLPALNVIGNFLSGREEVLAEE